MMGSVFNYIDMLQGIMINEKEEEKNVENSSRKSPIFSMVTNIIDSEASCFLVC